MPIYEYKCEDCGKDLEVMRKISDEPLTVCPNCGGKLAKQWSRSGFQFKGTGWYVTDYAGKGAEAKSVAKAENGEGKTESKTETSASGDAATKTSSDSESTASANAASKPETKSSTSD